MKKSLLSLALFAAFTSLAQAQSSVTIYGSFDGGRRYVDNVNAAGLNRLTVGSNGTYYSNRIGFKGVEDLGGGLNARFNLETGFNTGTGALESTTGSATTGTGAFWNRTATVGLGGSWGGIDIGHQYGVAFKTIALYDPFNYKFTSIIPLTGAAPGNGVSTAFGGTRFHNDIQYTGTFGPITARVEYALGEVAGAASTNRAWATGLSYASGPLTVGAAYTNKKVATTGGLAAGTAAAVGPPAVAGAAAATAASPTFDDNAWTAGAAYKFGALRVAGGYHQERLEGAAPTTAVAGLPLTARAGDARVRIGWFGAGFDISPAVNVTGAWYQSRFDTPTATAVTTGKENLFVIGATYALSKRTLAYAEVDWKKLDGNRVMGFGTTTTEDQTRGASIGISHLF